MMMPGKPKAAPDSDCDAPCPPAMPACEADASDAGPQDDVETVTR
jgi:hypothetical protein